MPPVERQGEKLSFHEIFLLRGMIWTFFQGCGMLSIRRGKRDAPPDGSRCDKIVAKEGET